MKTPFWAFRYETKRKSFEIVRVIEYSSKGIKIDRRIGSVFYGTAPIQKKDRYIGYSSFKRNYIHIKKVSNKIKRNLLKSVMRSV